MRAHDGAAPGGASGSACVRPGRLSAAVMPPERDDDERRGEHEGRGEDEEGGPEGHAAALWSGTPPTAYQPSDEIGKASRPVASRRYSRPLDW